MAVDIELNQKPGYLQITLRGRVGLAESQEILRRMITATEQTEVSPILLDVRAAECSLSYPDIVTLVTNLRDHRAALIPKIAVLYDEEHQGEAARFLELCAGNRGYPIRVFTACDEAIQWLGNTTTRTPPDKLQRLEVQGASGGGSTFGR